MMRAIGCEPKIQVRRVLEVTRVGVLAGCPGSLKVKLKLLVEAVSAS